MLRHLSCRVFLRKKWYINLQDIITSNANHFPTTIVRSAGLPFALDMGMQVTVAAMSDCSSHISKSFKGVKKSSVFHPTLLVVQEKLIFILIEQTGYFPLAGLCFYCCCFVCTWFIDFYIILQTMKCILKNHMIFWPL